MSLPSLTSAFPDLPTGNYFNLAVTTIDPEIRQRLYSVAVLRDATTPGASGTEVVVYETRVNERDVVKAAYRLAELAYLRASETENAQRVAVLNARFRAQAGE